MAICLSFPFSWVAQPGAWGLPLLGADFLCHFLSPKLNRGSGAQPLLVLVFSTASYPQLVWSSKLVRGSRRPLLPGAVFSTASFSNSLTPTPQKKPWISCALSYIIVQCPLRHRADITVMQKLNTWMRLIAFHIAPIPLGKVWIQLFSLQLWVNSKTDKVLQPWLGN